MPSKPALPALLAAVDAADDPSLNALLVRCSPTEQRAFMEALRSAYQAGEEAADQRSGRLMARIFGSFVGVTPGIDMNHDGHGDNPRARLMGMVRMLSGVARR